MKINYLSDSDENYACLEKNLKAGTLGRLIERHIYGAHKIPDKMIEVFDQVSTKIGIDKNAFSALFPDGLFLPTRFESPLLYSILDNLVKKIKKAAEDIGIETADFPLHSTIPTGLVNAQAVRLECASKDFLLFDSQIFTYCNLFAKAFALCLPFSGSRDDGYQFSVDRVEVSNHIKGNRQCIDRFEELLSVLDETETPSSATPYIPEDAYLQFATLLRQGMEIFLVAHEFGHVCAGHLENFISRSVINNSKIEPICDSHLQEYEADSIGLILTLKSITDDGYDVATAFIGAYLFFFALDLQDRYAFRLENGAADEYYGNKSETHPSNQERAQFLVYLLDHLPIDKIEVESTKHLIDQYSNILELVWTELEKRL